MKQLEVELKAIGEAFELAREQGISHVVIRMPVPLNRAAVDRRQLTLMDVLREEPQTHELLLDGGVMQEVTAAQLLDKLRMRGTPIDMIDSYLLAGEYDAAGLALRAVIIENVYEHLRTHKHLNVQLSSKQNPPVQIPEGYYFNVNFPFSTACVEPLAHRVPHTATPVLVCPPVFQMVSTQESCDVGDALRATVLRHVANTTAALLERIRQTLSTTEPTHVRLYPSWSTGALLTIPAAGDNYLPITSVGSHVVLGISAYQLKKKGIDV